MPDPIAFPFRPDWSDGIIERLSWLTAIQTSRSGAEQRQALRIAPRRQIDVPVLLSGQERSYFEVLMARNGGSAWYAPLPHEEVSVGLVTTEDTTIALDTAGREIAVGTKLLLRGRDALRSELVEVTSVASDSVSVSAVFGTYPAATITPTFKAVISEKTDMARRTGRVYTGTVRFTAVEPLIWPLNGRTPATLPTYRPGPTVPFYPILTQQPNAINDLTHSFERRWSTVDNSQSLPVYTDRTGRGFTSQQYSWFVYGRQEHLDFRDLLFALQGRAKPLWVPTFNDDLSIEQGYANPLGFLETTPPPGREYFAQFLYTGEVHGYAVTAYDGEDGIPSEVFNAGGVVRNSFMSLKRLDVDDIEILHHSTIDGVATASALFRDAPDLRLPLDFAAQGYSNSGYWPGVGDIGGRTPATNVSTGLTDILTITGSAGGGS